MTIIPRPEERQSRVPQITKMVRSFQHFLTFDIFLVTESHKNVKIIFPTFWSFFSIFICV